MSNIIYLENVDDVKNKKCESIKIAKAKYYPKKILNLSKEIVKELKSIMNPYVLRPTQSTHYVLTL
jgi:hypothetical protein